MKMMRKNWKDRSAVSPVIATILMVAITVVLAAVLYVMVMGFGGEDSQTPTVALGKRDGATAGNYEVYVISVSGGDIKASEVEVIVSGAGADSTSDTVVTQAVIDANANLKAGDYTKVKSTAAGGEVTVMFRDKASGNSLGQITFTASGYKPPTEP